jgi:hypothetical protein
MIDSEYKSLLFSIPILSSANEFAGLRTIPRQKDLARFEERGSCQSSVVSRSCSSGVGKTAAFKNKQIAAASCIRLLVFKAAIYIGQKMGMGK